MSQQGQLGFEIRLAKETVPLLIYFKLHRPGQLTLTAAVRLDCHYSRLQ